MYRKLRTKITLYSVSVLLLLFLGTILIVYTASYRETLNAEREMLARYADSYWKNGKPAAGLGFPPGEEPPESIPIAPAAGQFYSVEKDAAMNTVSVYDPDTGRISPGDLEEMAGRILASGKSDGTEGEWVYHAETRGDRTLVALLDNTLVSASSSALLYNTLRWGGLMVALLILGVHLTSGLLVKPLEKNEMRQRQFVSDAGHELKTPAAVIAANAELLGREIGENRWLLNIKAENARAGALVGQLLELTHLEEKDLPMERLDLSALTEEILLPFEGPAFERGHLVEASIRPGVEVRGSAQQLSTLISVLMDNAVRHSSEGSSIRVSLDREKGRAVLAVANQSERMTAEECSALFDRFYRRDPSRSAGEHYGMGLSIAQKIAENHRGSIGASWKDGNLTFRVVLPQA